MTRVWLDHTINRTENYSEACAEVLVVVNRSLIDFLGLEC